MAFKLSTLTENGVAGFIAKGKQTYRKEVARVGRWYVPHMDMWLDITPQRMQKWVRNFELMRSRSITVDLTIDHKDPASVEAKRGEVVNLFVQGEALYADVQLGDEDDEVLLKRAPEVSIEVEPNVTDGYGNRYDEALTAVSIVRKPVIAGQSGFEKIAASRQSRESTPTFVMDRRYLISEAREPDAWVTDVLRECNRSRT